MDGIFQLLEKFFSKTSKLTAIRMELKMKQGTIDNQPISHFFKQLKPKLIRHYGPCYHGYIWVREKARSKVQHYHLALLLDGQKVVVLDIMVPATTAISGSERKQGQKSSTTTWHCYLMGKRLNTQTMFTV